MELIRKLGTKISKSGHVVSYGLFLCPYCLKEVIKILSQGKKQKSCGCVANKLVSESKKGVKKSEETKLKISESLKGNIPWNRGKTNIYSEKVLLNMSEVKKGKKASEESKEKVSKTLKEKYKNGEMIPYNRIGENNSMYGKHHSEESKLKMSEFRIGKQVGENNPNWSGGISFEPYGLEFNESLKQSILERDSNKCQNPDCIIKNPKD